MPSTARKIPASGINLFQLIYILIREYEAKSGRKALNLSLGNPDLIPDAEIRRLKAQMQESKELAWHTYAEDTNLNGFCEGMLRHFVDIDLSHFPHLKAVPIPGIKTATAILPLACGLHLKASRQDFCVVTHLPAYDVMGTWNSTYLGAKRVVWPLRTENAMGLELSTLREALRQAQVESPDLIFVIRPGNPASRGATRQEWVSLIEFCLERDIRLVNDGAYTTLSPGTHVPLSKVACDYPELQWGELLSVSKAFSDPGGRLGTLVGSAALVEDFVLIKGNTESGPVPSLMAAYGELFKDAALTRRILSETLQTYQARLNYLIPALQKAGLQLACPTDAGFFTLWQTPDRAFGIDLSSEAARLNMGRHELFNRLVIERTGIVGVHFQGPAPDSKPYIRYAVCTDILLPEFKARLEHGLAAMRPEYA